MSSQINKIFLDLDGVIRDWCSGIFELFDLPPIKITSWNAMTAYVCKENGIPENFFWERQGYNFWADLKPYKHKKKLLSMLPKIHTCILTSPTLTSAGGTQRWIQKNLPYFFKNHQYLIGPAKKFCASPNALLIDDNDKHVEDFRIAGGNAILFPQPWNKNREFADFPLGYVDTILYGYLYGRNNAK